MPVPVRQQSLGAMEHRAAVSARRCWHPQASRAATSNDSIYLCRDVHLICVVWGSWLLCNWNMLRGGSMYSCGWPELASLQPHIGLNPALGPVGSGKLCLHKSVSTSAGRLGANVRAKRSQNRSWFWFGRKAATGCAAC